MSDGFMAPGGLRERSARRFLLLVPCRVETYCRAANRLRAPGGTGADARNMGATSVARRRQICIAAHGVVKPKRRSILPIRTCTIVVWPGGIGVIL